MQELVEVSKPTNRMLWIECLRSAEYQYQYDNPALLLAEALNSYYLSQGRWEMRQGQPAYISVDIERVAHLTENTSSRMLQNITGGILMDLAESTYSATSRRVLREVSARGDEGSVGLIQQEVLGTPSRPLSWHHRIEEAIYRETDEDALSRQLEHLNQILTLLSNLEG